ncbi:MAG: hypothetical protein IJB88_07185 [Clostridia bacterium]|nr:hypothetical protein [Clostridia bacterium]
MKIKGILILLAVCALVLCGCAGLGVSPIHTGETYIQGSWYFSEGGLNVGYNLFDDGGGYQFIGSVHNPIRYGIYNGNIYIAVNGGEAAAFTYEESDEGLVIGGLLYKPVEANEEVAESIANELAQLQSAPGQTGLDAVTIGYYISAAAGFGLVIFIIVWLVRTVKKREKPL